MFTDKRKAILIIEDEKGFCDIMAQVFRRKGYEVFIERKGKQISTLSILDLNYEKIELCIVDIETTGKIGASIFLKSLQNKIPSMKAIVVTRNEYELNEIKDQICVAVTNKVEDNPETMGRAALETIDYSQEAMLKHFVKVRKMERKERYEKTLKKKFKPSKLVEIPKPALIKSENVKKHDEKFKSFIKTEILKEIIKVFEASNRKERKFRWKAFKNLISTSGFLLRIHHIKSILKRWKELRNKSKVA